MEGYYSQALASGDHRVPGSQARSVVTKLMTRRASTPGAPPYRSEYLDYANQVYILLRTIDDSCQANDTWLHDALQRMAVQDFMKFFAESTGRIEALLPDSLRRVYFPIPDLCSYLSTSAKDNFVWSLDRYGSK
mmetsp:Transcript_38509/g.62402  ORF Transcript_38509/g.62402 Transcript_38509/m.62402 type:complete len:134 (-) Transcript_38509:68-469(-)